MPKKGANVTLSSYDDIFTTQEDRDAVGREQVQQIPVAELHPFEGHPFRVVDDDEMTKMMESISQFGVIAPLLARPDPYGGYEIISGHRRQHAAQLIGLETLPVIVREMDDDAAIIAMVDANLQRETILPSEKAWAYKMKLEAIKHQGERSDLTSCQIGTKLENGGTCAQLGYKSGTDLTSSQVGMKLENGGTSTQNVAKLEGNPTSCQIGTKFRADEKVAEGTPDSPRTVQRFIRLTNLIPELSDMVDQKKLAMNPAVELSYLTKEEQEQFLEAMDFAQATPSLSQAQRIKKLSQDGECTLDAMCDTMNEVKKGELERVVFSTSALRKYFPKSYTSKQMENTIIKLLEQWQKKRNREQSR